MKPKTEKEYRAAVAANPYFKDRWSYFKPVYGLLSEMKPTSMLEAGAHDYPLYSDSTTVDIGRGANTDVVADITRTLPFKDKEFDVYMALQVWEHLKGGQRAAFAEAQRVAHRVVLSFPYKWRNPEDKTHYNLDDDVFEGWVGRPSKRLVIPSENGHCRVVYVFE
jgi:hypothetical protein